jgi:hypothetical protein
MAGAGHAGAAGAAHVADPGLVVSTDGCGPSIVACTLASAALRS